MKKAYIFDLDGVLIDSKHMMSQAWQMCELEHKLEQPFSEYFKHIGMPFKDILKTIGIKDNHDKIKYTYAFDTPLRCSLISLSTASGLRSGSSP